MPAPSVLKPHSADAVLAQSAREGDRAAFGSLYQLYRPMVHGILLAYVPFADAEDLLQRVFVRALERIAQLRDAEAFGAWLAAIARNVALGHHRARVEFVEIDESLACSPRRDWNGQSESALEAIRRLPPAYRETLVLRLVEGLTGSEISARTCLTPESVRVNLCRGMKLLRAHLKGTTKHG